MTTFTVCLGSLLWAGLRVGSRRGLSLGGNLSLTDHVHVSFRGEAFPAFPPRPPTNDSTLYLVLWVGLGSKPDPPQLWQTSINTTSNPEHKRIFHTALGTDWIYQPRCRAGRYIFYPYFLPVSQQLSVFTRCKGLVQFLAHPLPL